MYYSQSKTLLLKPFILTKYKIMARDALSSP